MEIILPRRIRRRWNLAHIFQGKKPSSYGLGNTVYTAESDGVREKKQGHRVVKDTVCYVYGIRRGVTADNFFTSCELANSRLTQNMRVVGTLRKNKLLLSLILPVT